MPDGTGRSSGVMECLGLELVSSTQAATKPEGVKPQPKPKALNPKPKKSLRRALILHVGFLLQSFGVRGEALGNRVCRGDRL